MSAGWEVALVVIGLTGAAVNGGAFFAFSNFVMPALARLQPGDGAAAMQAINVAAPTPTFVSAIVSAGLVGVPVVVANLDRLDETAVRYVVAGVVLSLGSFLITAASNVPRNNALDGVDARSPAGQSYWARYLTSWTRLNTLRTVTSLASVATYALALSV
ncbi:MAG: anthrone oxygenase family protein [Actinomycetota bacterium]